MLDVLLLVLASKTAFSSFQLVCDGPTDGPTDGRTDLRTDIPSYRDARTHLKRLHKIRRNAMSPTAFSCFITTFVAFETVLCTMCVDNVSVDDEKINY